MIQSQPMPTRTAVFLIRNYGRICRPRLKIALARIKSPEITTEIHRSDGETVQVKGEAVTPGMVIEKDEDGKFVLWHINSGKYIAKYRNRESAILCAKVLSQHGDLSALDESEVVQLVRENKLQNS